MFRPSYADDGSFDDLPASSPLLSEPPHRLRLERTHGYHGGGFYPSTDTNAYFLGEDHMPKGGSGSSSSGRGGGEEGVEVFEVVYPTAALVVMHKFRVQEEVKGEGEKGEGREAGWEGRSSGNWGGKRDGETTQRFFDGHTDDVTAVAVHPGGVLVASGQVREPACFAGFSVFGKPVCNKPLSRLCRRGGSCFDVCVLLFLWAGDCLQGVISVGKSSAYGAADPTNVAAIRTCHERACCRLPWSYLSCVSQTTRYSHW